MPPMSSTFSPAISPTAFDTRPPDLPPASLMDTDFVVSCQLVRRRRPLIRFLYIGPHLCSTLPSDPASRRRPCASLTFTSIRLGRDFHPPAAEHARRTTGNAGPKPALYNDPTHADRGGRSFISAFAVTVAGMHGVAFRGTRFVNDALEEAANGGVGQRTGIVALGIGEHFAFTVGLVQRNPRLLLELADFQSAVRALIQELD